MRPATFAGILALGLGLLGARPGAASQASHATLVPAAGSTTSIDGVSISVRPGQRLTGNNSGETMYGVVITLHNAGSASYQFDDTNFEALDARAFDYEALPDSRFAHVLQNGTLKPGDTAAGTLGFNLPAGSRPLAIRWSPGQLGQDFPLDKVVALPGAAGSPRPAGPTGADAASGGLALTVGAVRNDGTQGSALPSGQVFYSVHATLTNRGKASLAYNDGYFALLNTQGVAYGPTVSNNRAKGLGSGKLAPGQTVSGSMGFVGLASRPPVAIRWIADTGTGYNTLHIVILPTK